MFMVSFFFVKFLFGIRKIIVTIRKQMLHPNPGSFFVKWKE